VTEELVDVVDPDDRVIDTVSRSMMRRDRLRHRVTFVVVRASDGRVLVHRRSDDKDLWPGRWDLAVGGVVRAGEGYDDAAARELAEEIGVVGSRLSRLGPGRYEDGDVRLLAMLYEVTSDGPFTFADGEVVEARFVTVGELGGLVDHQPFVPDSVALLMPLLSDPSGPAPTPPYPN
jgi:8-oxo-dGTP pyrophosphatase MutT (NUDIX family)